MRAGRDVTPGGLSGVRQANRATDRHRLKALVPPAIARAGRADNGHADRGSMPTVPNRSARVTATTTLCVLRMQPGERPVSIENEITQLEFLDLSRATP